MSGFVAFPLSPPGFDGDLPVSDQLWPSAGGRGRSTSNLLPQRRGGGSPRGTYHFCKNDVEM